VITQLVMVKSNAVGKNIVFIKVVQHVVKSCLAMVDRRHTAAFAHYLHCHHTLLWYWSCTYMSKAQVL